MPPLFLSQHPEKNFHIGPLGFFHRRAVKLFGGALRFFRRTGEGIYDMADFARATAKMAAFIEAVNAAKPREAKGQYIRGATLTTTMGPGIRLDLAETMAMKLA